MQASDSHPVVQEGSQNLGDSDGGMRKAGNGALDGVQGVIAVLGWAYPHPLSPGDVASLLNDRPKEAIAALLRNLPQAILDIETQEVGLWRLSTSPGSVRLIRRICLSGGGVGWWRHIVALAGWSGGWLHRAPGTRAAWYLGGRPDGPAPEIEGIAARSLGINVLLLPGPPEGWGLSREKAIPLVPPVLAPAALPERRS